MSACGVVYLVIGEQHGAIRLDVMREVLNKTFQYFILDDEGNLSFVCRQAIIDTSGLRSGRWMDRVVRTFARPEEKTPQFSFTRESAENMRAFAGRLRWLFARAARAVRECCRSRIVLVQYYSYMTVFCM